MWAQHGIRVNAEISDPAHRTLGARSLSGIPLGRLGEPPEIVGPVLFLAWAAASMVTGVMLPVDGGNPGHERRGQHRLVVPGGPRQPRSAAVVVRTRASVRARRSGCSLVPRPGPGGGAICPSAMLGRVVTTSAYQLV